VSDRFLEDESSRPTVPARDVAPPPLDATPTSDTAQTTDTAEGEPTGTSLERSEQPPPALDADADADHDEPKQLPENSGGDPRGADRVDEGDEHRLYRADTRGSDIIFNEGFQPKGSNVDLQQHLDQNPPDSGFVSTSKDYESAVAFGKEFGADQVYTVHAQGIDVNDLYGKDSPYPWENEVAVPGGIPAHDVEGVWGPEGWQSNPGFRR